MSDTNDMQREFEAWCERNKRSTILDKTREFYWYAETEAAWFGYQAASEIATPKWFPIETAPHGKSIFVGYTNSQEKWRSVIACFYEAGCLMADESCDNCDEDGYAHPGWYEECESQESILPTNQIPTHWMPLPTQPAIRQGGST